jgi:hypothetical protein
MSRDPSTSKLCGLVTRRERWGLSGRGWGLLMLAVLLAGLGGIPACHPFLAVTHRVPARVLVVEGWLHIYGVNGAMREFKTGGYDQLLTTGGPVAGLGPTSSIYDTEAWQSAGFLRRAGLSTNVIQVVPSCFVGRDRTYNSAVALRQWLQAHNPHLDSLNVLTEDAHARRTWMLFQAALGPGVRVGVIALPDPDYDARHWWRSSEGVREVLDEGIAYLYAKFFFWPPRPAAI